jgi:RNA polymerase sigma-70 factor (ECF subfamily)
MGEIIMIGRTQQLREELGVGVAPLLAGAACGDAESRDRLVEAARRMAFDLGRRAYRMGWEDAEDFAQDVALRVSERLSQLRSAEAFPVWVRRIVHHAAMDTLNRRRPLLSSLSSGAVTTGADEEKPLGSLPDLRSDAEYEQILVRITLDRALTSLPDLYREPLRLHLLDDLSQEEVGKVLGRPRSTVATQIERGLGRLRRAAPALLAR